MIDYNWNKRAVIDIKDVKAENTPDGIMFYTMPTDKAFKIATVTLKELETLVKLATATAKIPTVEKETVKKSTKEVVVDDLTYKAFMAWKVNQAKKTTGKAKAK